MVLKGSLARRRGKKSSSYNKSEEDGVETNSLSDAGMAALGEGFPKLEKLSLIWCSNISSVGLTSLAQKCRLLKSLDLQVSFYSGIVLYLVSSLISILFGFALY